MGILINLFLAAVVFLLFMLWDGIKKCEERYWERQIEKMEPVWELRDRLKQEAANKWLASGYIELSIKSSELIRYGYVEEGHELFRQSQELQERIYKEIRQDFAKHGLEWDGKF